MSVILPSDLEEEILSRVPWKSLAKLRCVCKRWSILILEERLNKKNMSFHHMHSSSGEHRLIISDTGPKISSVCMEEHQNNLDVEDPPSLIVQDFSLIKSRLPCDSIKVYKTVHCDGLLLCVMDNQLLVWNPLLKETTWIKCGSDFHQLDDAYSLGYLNHRDYRILRFRCASNSRNRPSRVEVCDVASKTWKVIDNISFDWFLSVQVSILSLRGTPYCIGIREDDDTPFLQSYDFARERFQHIDEMPFSYDELNPIAIEIYKGDRLSVLEQCHKTRKICIWVKHWLMLTSWTKLLVVDIPEFPLLYPRPSRLSTNYYFDKKDRLVITCNHTRLHGLSIIRVINDKEFQVTKANYGETGFAFLCRYGPSFLRLPGFSKQDTTRIRWRKRWFN